jgi:hypothetical protein
MDIQPCSPIHQTLNHKSLKIGGLQTENKAIFFLTRQCHAQAMLSELSKSIQKEIISNEEKRKADLYFENKALN